MKRFYFPLFLLFLLFGLPRCQGFYAPGEGLNPDNYLGGTEAGNPPSLEPDRPDDSRTGHRDPCVEDPESTDEDDCYEVESDGKVQPNGNLNPIEAAPQFEGTPTRREDCEDCDSDHRQDEDSGFRDSRED